MNENYIEKYVDIEGNIRERKYIEKIKMIIFAGTKFMLDRVLAILGLILLSPIILIISLLIKIDSKGPIFFKQERTGKNGEDFYVYKFRTMIAENDVHDFSKADKHTKIGEILRKTSLDEIPQLWSIATAKMSFIGPRPWIPDYFNNMNDIQRHRYCVRPGLTGLAQAMGRNDIDIFKKIRYDLEYIENYSFTQDIKVIMLTIREVFTTKGADAGKNTIQKELEDLKNFNNVRKNVEILETVTKIAQLWRVNYSGKKYATRQFTKKENIWTYFFMHMNLI